MERRRPRLDPLLAEQANERLAFLLSDRAPRRARAQHEPILTDRTEPPTVATPGPVSGPPDVDPVDSDLPGLEALDDLPPVRRFNRRHMGVLAVLVVLGLLGGGWSLLRARPVALASPGEIVVSAPSGSGGPAISGGPALPGGPTISSGPSGTASPSEVRIVVHVLGAVRRPGLVTLAGPTRVQDAIDAAGGFTSNANPGELNLAQPLTDGQQILIGSRSKPAGEVRDGGSGPGAGAGPDPGGTASGLTLDLNRATEAQLEELPGVGPVMAGKIIAWRTEHTRFSRVEELQEVDGVGPKTFAQIAPHVRV